MSASSENSFQAELAQLRARIADLEHDLATAHQREESLLDTQRRLQFIVDGSGAGAWDWNMTTNEAFFSPRWFEILGYQPNELPSNADTWMSRLHPDEVGMITQALQDYIAGNKTEFSIENRMLCKSGEWLWTHSNGKVSERDAHGQPLRMTGTVNDISARKRAEEQLLQSQQLLKSFFDHSPSVIYLLGTNERYLMSNTNHAALLGARPEDIVGKRATDFFPLETAQNLTKANHQIIEKGQTVITEEMIPRTDGEHIYMSVKFPIYDSAGKVFAIGGIATDVTEQRHAAEERVSLQQQIIDAQNSALRELSSPLIPIADGVLVMPLVGIVDVQRTQLVIEHLLDGVVAHHAASVILDITGVQIVDTYVATALVQAAQAVNLLGAEVIVTGIRPEIAQTIVGMGADLRGVVTQATLQNGIAYVLKRRGKFSLR